MFVSQSSSVGQLLVVSPIVLQEARALGMNSRQQAQHCLRIISHYDLSVELSGGPLSIIFYTWHGNPRDTRGLQCSFGGPDHWQ